ASRKRCQGGLAANRSVPPSSTMSWVTREDPPAACEPAPPLPPSRCCQVTSPSYSTSSGRLRATITPLISKDRAMTVPPTVFCQDGPLFAAARPAGCAAGPRSPERGAGDAPFVTGAAAFGEASPGRPAGAGALEDDAPAGAGATASGSGPVSSGAFFRESSGSSSWAPSPSCFFRPAG